MDALYDDINKTKIQRKKMIKTIITYLYNSDINFSTKLKRNYCYNTSNIIFNQ